MYFIVLQTTTVLADVWFGASRQEASHLAEVCGQLCHLVKQVHYVCLTGPQDVVFSEHILVIK
jgi:hypothetical protein